jgi:hypothetical protein
MDLTTIAVVLLGMAALGGTGLAIARRREKDVPFAFALGHGITALAGYGTLAAVVLGAGGMEGLFPIALGALTISALGGAMFFVFRLRDKRIPMSFIAGHALVATAGYGCLLYAAYG